MEHKFTGTSDPQAIAIANQTMILNMVRESKTATRAKLAQQLRLSPPSVSSNVERLINKRILVECGSDNEKPERPGRKGVLLMLNPAYKKILAVDLSSKIIRIGIGDLQEQILYANQYAPQENEGINDSVIRSIDSFIGESKIGMDDIGVIVVCAPGIIDQTTGEVEYAPQLEGLERSGLKRALESQYNTSVLIKNDVNIRTLAEMRYGLGAETKNFMHIHIDIGVGAGLVIDGRLVEGSRFACGEIGYSVLDISQLDEKHNYGHLENHIAIPNLLCKIQKEMQWEDSRPLTIEQVNQLYQEGDEYVISQIDLFARRIAFVIANATVLLDISKISVGGAVTELEVDLEDRINHMLRYVMPYRPQVSFSALDSTAFLLGAFDIGTEQLLRESVAR